MQAKQLSSDNQDLILAGDGRNDSPGYCAQYCTYSLMDVNTSKIVAMTVVDCRQTELKSVNMEKLGLITSLDNILEKATVSEIVTDAHVQIRALLSEFFN